MKQKLLLILPLICLFNLNLFSRDSSAKPELRNVTPDSSRTEAAQDSNQKSISSNTDKTASTSPREKSSGINWAAVAALVGLGGLIFGVYQYLMRKKEAEQKKRGELEAETEFRQEKESFKTKTLEEQYCSVLEEELGSIRLLGSPDIETLPVKLLDAFVTLDISETWRSETRFDSRKMKEETEPGRYSKPEKVMQRAFQKYRLLLIVGDPGSGKTTLSKYYVMCCLSDDGYKTLGFNTRPLPIYLPLRELEPNDGEPASLPQNLEDWAKKHLLDIPAKIFNDWLHRRNTLVLLDGLDEISDLDQRRRVCEWIDRTCASLKKARFVVTSRWTGYRKIDGIELGFDHLRADVRDFSPEKQEDFLRKWFKAVYLRELPDENVAEVIWRERQKKIAGQRAQTIINFLKKEENKSLRQLAAVPMLLQIMAVIWKNREHLPHSRAALYSAALSYLLDYRDRRRKLEPVLPADKARRVLAPVALWMQEEVLKDEVPKNDMHDTMQPILNTLDTPPAAEVFCSNLRDRAGLLADYGRNAYIFRHKSFREYLAGQQLIRDCLQPGRLEKLADNFGDDWWEEPLRFFVSEGDDRIFDSFMEVLFRSGVSEELDQKAQNLLQLLIREAPQKKVDALADCLNDKRLSDRKKRYILDCLKTIGTSEAWKAIEGFKKKGTANKIVLNYAEEITAETAEAVTETIEKQLPADIFKSLPPAFRNPHEDNAEYILIPGGEYKYSVSGKTEKVPDIYFAKYTVTNKRYRRFTAYLEGKSGGLEKRLPREVFAENLNKFAGTIKGFREYLGRDGQGRAEKLRSGSDEEKRFNREDQPVVGITWFAATAYCYWLTELERAGSEEREGQINPKLIFRLPREVEWEWAAAGREPDGSLREYPWPKDKGGPSPELANYNGNVDATTPVGRYPEGATPEGLMDMAGNVWEWMENWYDKDEDVRSLRGGSWNDLDVALRCSARGYGHPAARDDVTGFRVVRSRS
jgi:formylglycine-generating enzyme required for sulfatase activity